MHPRQVRFTELFRSVQSERLHDMRFRWTADLPTLAARDCADGLALVSVPLPVARADPLQEQTFIFGKAVHAFLVQPTEKFVSAKFFFAFDFKLTLPLGGAPLFEPASERTGLIVSMVGASFQTGISLREVVAEQFILDFGFRWSLFFLLGSEVQEDRQDHE